MSTLKYNTWLNTDNTENYKCRAWVNFNGTGTVAIRASGNVSSITDNGTADYTVNFTNALPDANYSYNATATINTNAGQAVSAPSTTALRIGLERSDGAAVDTSYVTVSIFR